MDAFRRRDKLTVHVCIHVYNDLICIFTFSVITVKLNIYV